jgi:hypothetical protein
VSIRTQLAGAFRQARNGEPVPVVETFTYTAGDVLLGQEGWQLRSMREAGDVAIVERAWGRWEHPMHRGSWHRIVTERVEFDQRPASPTHRAEVIRVVVEVSDAQVSITVDGVTRRWPLPPGTQLLTASHAGWGPVVETASRQATQTLPILVVSRRLAEVGAPGPHFGRLTAERVGRAVFETPDGAVRADEYAIELRDLEVGSTDGTSSPAIDRQARWFLGGDGMLTGYASGADIVWRAASAPSRA